ncbi:MAG: 2OG-Fe(II) oxygenase [Oscillatoria princeps RMCB-10]|jgi:predicted 2-oxoglutarate/Fe(II)-dependent dioxygenase YbiX|nr:2OG-Fe(II) oxygenase [Oscillatoria princeps RMCB-10]
MVEPSLTDLGNEIFLVERLLNSSLCDHIIQIAECAQFAQAGIALETADPQLRNNQQLRLEGSSLLDSTNELLLGAVAVIQNMLYQHYGILFKHVETCSILRYQKGQLYKRHIDNLLLDSRLKEAANEIPIRDISIVGYLNEDFEGGETLFDRQNLKVKPQSGSVLVFPSYYTHPHQSLPVREGKKYCFTTWLFH